MRHQCPHQNPVVWLTGFAMSRVGAVGASSRGHPHPAAAERVPTGNAGAAPTFLQS